MSKHNKPTQEELDQIAAELEEAKQKEGETEDEENNDEASPKTKEGNDDEKDVDDGSKGNETNDGQKRDEEEGKKDGDVKDKAVEDTDYKKKFVESSREAQILYSKQKKLNEVISNASEVTEPTQEELVKEYPEWEEMTPNEQKLAKKGLMNDKRFAAISEATREFKDIDAWSAKVDTYVEDPSVLVSYPKLEGKMDEFKTFANKETRRGVDFSVLVSSFLYELSETKSAQPAKKGKMFETGSGGPNDTGKPKGGKISGDEASRLRNTNYKEFTRLLKAGAIEEDF